MFERTLVALVASLSLVVVVACGGDDESAPTTESDTGSTADTTASDSGGDDVDAGGTDTVGADGGGGIIPGSCGYPMPTGFGIGDVVPDLIWENAYRGDGSTLTLDLEEVFCDAQWDWVSTIHFVVTTGWCPNCPNYINYVDSLAAQIEAQGGLVVYVTTETSGGAPATNDYANQHVTESAPNGTGIRVGDGDAQPAMQIAAAPIIEFVPTSFVVRKADMTVIADQRLSEYNLPFVEIATQPELDWSNPGAPTVRPEVPANCDEDDEEVYEPNNRIADAKTIGVGQFEGGICDSNPDFYYVDVPGRWSLYLGFDNEVGDLDAYVWDVETQRAAVDELGDDIGGYTTDDDEYFEFEGPAYLYIVGYRQQTAPYTLLVTAL